MKTVLPLLIIALIYACGASKVVEHEDQLHCFVHEPVRTEKKHFYQLIYEITDTIAKTNIPLHTDSTLVMHPRDSICPMGKIMQKIEYPEMWKEQQIQGTSYYSLMVDEFGEIQSIVQLRSIYKSNDLLLPQLQRHLLHLKFVEEKYFNKEYLFRLQLRIS